MISVYINNIKLSYILIKHSKYIQTLINDTIHGNVINITLYYTWCTEDIINKITKLLKQYTDNTVCDMSVIDKDIIDFIEFFEIDNVELLVKKIYTKILTFPKVDNPFLNEWKECL